MRLARTYGGLLPHEWLAVAFVSIGAAALFMLAVVIAFSFPG